MSPSEKGSALKGKNLLPWGANSFLFEKTSFQNHGNNFFPFRADPLSERVWLTRVGKLELAKIVSFVKMAENIPSVIYPLK